MVRPAHEHALSVSGIPIHPALETGRPVTRTLAAITSRHGTSISFPGGPFDLPSHGSVYGSVQGPEELTMVTREELRFPGGVGLGGRISKTASSLPF